MPKSSPHTPAFLKGRLDPDKMDLVRDCFPKWFEKAKDQLGAEPKFSIDAVHEFVQYLGKKDRKFKGIHRDALITTHTGTYKIYDYMRKRMGKPDEKQLTNPASKSKAKTTPAKL